MTARWKYEWVEVNPVKEGDVINYVPVTNGRAGVCYAFKPIRTKKKSTKKDRGQL